jgi:hypothetical protein
MLADEVDFVVGVDPHRDSHALAVVYVVSGAVVFETTVVANSDGYAHALALVEEHAAGRRAFAIEGTGSYGARPDAFPRRSGRTGARGWQAAAGAPLGRQDRRARCRPGGPQRAYPAAAGDTAGRRGTPGIAGVGRRPGKEL